MAKHSSDPPAPARGTAAFQSRNFLRYQIARLLAIVGAEAQAVAVAWQVYQITHRALDLGYTGLALFLPSILFLLPAGHVADRYDRRHVVILCYSVQTLFSGALLWLSWHGVHSILPIYALLFGIGSGRAFSAPASQALLPHLVPRNLWVNAVTWGSTIFLIAKVTGPAVGGILFTLPLGNACSGPIAVYMFTMVTLLLFVGLLVSVDVKIGRSEHASLSLHTLLAGFRYVFHTKVLLARRRSIFLPCCWEARPRCCRFMRRTFCMRGHEDWACCVLLRRWARCASRCISRGDRRREGPAF